MGTTDSHEVTSVIEASYKSKRKYHDHLYGEITVVEDKSQQTQYALIEKVVLAPSKELNKYLDQQINNPKPYLLRLYRRFKHNIDLCSTSQKQYFVVEYCNRTLYDQIIRRQQKSNYFSLLQLYKLFHSYAESVFYLRSNSKKFQLKAPRFVISNALQAYTQTGIKSIDPIISNAQEQNQFDLGQNSAHQETQRRSVYLSPQSYTYLMRRQKLRAREENITQASIVFTLGMNFLECILLADISDIYDYAKGLVDFQKVHQTVQEVYTVYGQQMYQLLSHMTNQQPKSRPSLQQIKQILRICIRSYRQSNKSQRQSGTTPSKNLVSSLNYY